MPVACQGTETGLWVLFLGTWLAFTAAYLLLHRADPAHLEFGDPWVDAAYFSATVTSTTGFGDILPRTRLAKSVVVLNQLAAMGLVATLVCRALRGRW